MTNKPIHELNGIPVVDEAFAEGPEDHTPEGREVSSTRNVEEEQKEREFALAIANVLASAMKDTLAAIKRRMIDGRLYINTSGQICYVERRADSNLLNPHGSEDVPRVLPGVDDLNAQIAELRKRYDGISIPQQFTLPSKRKN